MGNESHASMCMTPQISDFGLAFPAQILEEPDTFFQYSYGSIVYAAPEVLRGEGYWPESDIFSVGVSLWEALTRKSAHAGLNKGEIFCRVATGKPSFEMPLCLTKKLSEFMSRLLAFDRRERPSSKAVANYLSEFLLETNRQVNDSIHSFFDL